MNNKQITNALFLGFSLIDINNLTQRIEGDRDKLILEIMIYYKKVAANFILEIDEKELRDILHFNNEVLSQIKLPYIDFIIGTILISNTILSSKNLNNKDIEQFMHITSVYYDLYTDIINEIRDKNIKELYKNSFNEAERIFKKFKDLK